MTTETTPKNLKLNKAQLQTVITEHIVQDNGLNDLYEMLLNGLMYSERRIFLKTSEPGTNKGNGYRQLTKNGIGSKLSLNIPRDRLGVFRPVIQGLLNQQEEQINDLTFSLYGKGLTTRQISDVLAGIYGDRYSKSNVSKITTEFYKLTEAWANKSLEDYYPVIFIDAIHLKVRRDTVGTEAFYIILGVKKDQTREILGIMNLPNESASGWEDMLQQIKSRGVQDVGLVVFDDLTGLNMAVGKQFPTADRQKCVVHLQRNLAKKYA